MTRTTKECLLLSGLLTASAPAWCYRPFDSTDADVVDRGETEIELGYVSWERSDGDDTFVAPQLVFNKGLADALELVAEFEVEHPSGASSELVDPALFLKAVVRKGVLQEAHGISLAVEAGPLIPSTASGEGDFGFEGIVIASGRTSGFTYHLNVGGGVTRSERRSFGLWGVIVERRVSPGLTAVGEVSGESTAGEAPDNSALVGFIWEPRATSITFDGGIRKGISSAAPNWGLTFGLTFSFQ